MIIALIILFIIIILYTEYSRGRLKNTKSTIDNNTYLVLDGNIKSANILAKLNSIAVQLIDYLKSKYNTSSNKNDYVRNLAALYRSTKLKESQWVTKDLTSFTYGRGIFISMCLKNTFNELDGVNGLISGVDSDFNTLIFVFLHELAHIGLDKNGHETNFWQVFKFLLEEAQMCGLYENIDYSKHPIMYCNIAVKYNPYYDNNLKSLID